MNQLLKEKQKVRTANTNTECVIGKYLGGGGQGEVYKAVLSGKEVAVKWYFTHQATELQKKSLEILIQKGAPSDQFLWPLDIVVADGQSGYGYIMPLREPQYKNVVDLLKRRTEPTFYSLATSCMQLAHNFLLLHGKGLYFRDISWDNVFFHPETGDVLICDNDNVGINGETEVNVLGTPRFMAPEIVRGESLPCTYSDLFSLAVLIFYMLIVHHPFDGEKEASIERYDQSAMKKIYGTDPIFIFDPDDVSNRPRKGYQDNALAFWPIYPKFIQDLFIQSFTTGIKDPNSGRVRESEWRKSMSQLRDYVLYCHHCRMENFYDDDALKIKGKLNPCWKCGKDIILPPRIRIGKSIIMLNANTKLYPHHVDDKRSWDFSKPVAEINQHPKDPNIWGLRNMSSVKWNIVYEDGKIMDVEPEKSLRLSNNLTVNFGTTEGQIYSCGDSREDIIY